MADNGNKKEQITLTIDGRSITADKGMTVFEAALQAGIEIPYFCWHPKLDSIGACRMCLVEIEKFPKPMVSCATEVMPGMIVRTNNETIIKARRGVLEFLLLNHPLDCPTCDKGGECDLQDNVFKHGIDKSRYTFTKQRVIDAETRTTFDDKRIGPEVIRNMNRCVTCFRCVRFNKEIAGEFDLGAYQRGNHTVIDSPPGEQIDNLYSGNVVEICPVGALTNTDWRYKVRVWKTEKAASICCHDADGQNITLWYDRREIYRATSRRNDDIDEGWICDLARYGYQYINSPNRLTQPLIKRDGKQVPATWDDAIRLIARRFAEIKQKKGAVCIAGLAGSSQSTETYYLLNRFFRTGLQSNSVDYRLEFIDLKDDERVEAYNSLFTAPFRIADLEKADTVFVFASNFIKEHPALHLRLRKAYTKFGTKVYTANPVETKSADISSDELIYRPEAEVAFLVAMLHAIIDQSLYRDITKEAAAQVKAKLAPASLSEAAAICDLEPERITRLARALADSKNLFIIGGDYLKTSTQRYALANALHNIAGLLGVEDGRAIIPASRANALGADRMGLRPAPSRATQQALESQWQEKFPAVPGMNTSKIFKGVLDDEIDALFVLGANPALKYPDGPFVNAALDKLDFLIVADLFETATTAKADVVLPLAGWSESPGSYVNLEGRSQRFERALPPRPGVKTGIEIIRAIAEAMGITLSSDDAALEAASQATLDSWVRTPRSTDRFYDVKAVPVADHSGYPYKLLTGNDLHHFGYLTEHCPSLMRFTPEPYLELSYIMAERLGIKGGTMVRVESPTGKVALKARLSEHFEGDVLFVPNNFSSVEVNALISHDGGGWVRLEKLDET